MALAPVAAVLRHHHDLLEVADGGGVVGDAVAPEGGADQAGDLDAGSDQVFDPAPCLGRTRTALETDDGLHVIAEGLVVE